MTSFLPGFDVEGVQVLDKIEPLPRGNSPISNREIPTHLFDAFAFRVRQFTQGLPAGRRREIEARPRFYRLAWIRRADELDADDLPL